MKASKIPPDSSACGGTGRSSADVKSVVVLAALALAAPAFTQAAEKSLGQWEYETRCMSCHGATGKGDGWFAGFLKRPPPSLARLQKDNGGVFPFDRVYQVIDGRKEVQVHGPREMPVWGWVYRLESGRAYDPGLGVYLPDDGSIRARILALIEHLSRLQE